MSRSLALSWGAYAPLICEAFFTACNTGRFETCKFSIGS